MKLTDGLFKIPVKIYDRFSVAKNEREEAEKLDELDAPLIDDWVAGYQYIPFDSILGYRDAFSEGRTMEDVAKNGFDGTLIYTSMFGKLECLWKVDKFEKEFNAFVEKYEKGIQDIIQEAFAEKELNAESNKKKAWWKK